LKLVTQLHPMHRVYQGAMPCFCVHHFCIFSTGIAAFGQITRSLRLHSSQSHDAHLRNANRVPFIYV
jgi:hypothetical protein